MRYAVNMDTEAVRETADHLRQYATHFEPRDWDYTRNLGGLTALRYDRREDSLQGRLAAALRWLTRRPAEWEKVFQIPRWRMAVHALKRDRHLPDGVLDNGGVITIWEETGEYLQYVQPTVGALLADLMDAHPALPEVRAVASEMRRIQSRYAARIAEGDVT